MDYQNMQLGQQVPRRIMIAKMISMSTGTFNPMYSRPYITHVDGTSLEIVEERLDKVKGTSVTPEVFSGIGNNILQPSASHQGMLDIPHGWDTRRRQFMLEVHEISPTGSTCIYYFTGYTNFDQIIGDMLDPQTEFFINSYVKVSRNMQNFNGMGMQVFDRVIESAQIINGQIVSQSDAGEIYTMRPMDIFHGIQSDYLRQAYETSGPNAVFDDRRFKSIGESVRSNRSNNLPNHFLAKVVDSQRVGVEMLDIGQDSAGILQRASQYCYEESIYENSFLRMLARAKGLNGPAISFNEADLLGMDPNYPNVRTHYALDPREMMRLPRAGETEYWSGADGTTMAALKLANAIPALMMENFLAEAVITSNNHSVGGAMFTKVLPVRGFTSSDLTRNCEIVARRLENEVLYDMSFGNQELFSFTIEANILSQLKISIAFGTGAATDFLLPTFCDGLLTPVVTSVRDNFNHVVNDMEQITARAVGNTGMAASLYNASI